MPSHSGVACCAQQVDAVHVYSVEVLVKALARYFTLSDLIHWETTCKSVRNSVGNSLRWKSACYVDTLLALSAADEKISSILASIEAFTEEMDELIYCGVTDVQETRQRRHLFGYWGLARHQRTFLTPVYFHLDYSWEDVEHILTVMKRSHDYTSLHEVVTRRIRALSAELRRLAEIDQGKPLLARCLQVMSGNAYDPEANFTVEAFAVIRFEIAHVENVMETLFPDEEVFTEFRFWQRKFGNMSYAEACEYVAPHEFETPNDNVHLADSRGWFVQAWSIDALI